MLKLPGFVCAIALAMSSVFATAAAADDDVRVEVEQNSDDDDSWSVLEYGWYGLGDGLGVGLAAGYLATGSEFESDEWDIIGLGAGVGALGGIGVGLMLGIMDIGKDGPGLGASALQNMGYGLGLGTVGGLIVGGIVAVSSEDAKDVLVGGSVGALVGSGVGLILGLVQGAADEEQDDIDAEVASVDLTLKTMRDGAGEMVWMPTAFGTF